MGARKRKLISQIRKMGSEAEVARLEVLFNSLADHGDGSVPDVMLFFLFFRVP